MAAKLDEMQRRDFTRRATATRQGVYFPSEDDLLQGSGFFCGSIQQDIREYASRLSRRLKKRNAAEALAPLVGALDDLTVDQSKEALRSLLEAVEPLIEGGELPPLEACSFRCHYYLAFFGDSYAAAVVAGKAATIALGDLNDTRDLSMLYRSLAWARMSHTLTHVVARGEIYCTPSSLASMLSSFEVEITTTINGVMEMKSQGRDDVSSAFEEPDPKATRAADTSGEGSIVVIPAIGNTHAPDGERVAKEFEEISQRRLPLPLAPDVGEVQPKLTSEFPWAASVIDTMLRDIAGSNFARLRPTILVGPPGCGKTRFASRMVEELGLPYEMVSCGGMSDSTLGGTARRWTSGEPSLPVKIVRHHKCAGPAIILDEVEKIGTGHHNGSLHDVLIGLLGEETSFRWLDPYIQSACNLSQLTWLMTANDLQHTSSALRDRCRVLCFPEPRREDLPLLLRSILEKHYTSRGLDPRWARPLDNFEHQLLTQAWKGGSIRALERYVDTITVTRDRYGAAH